MALAQSGMNGSIIGGVFDQTGLYVDRCMMYIHHMAVSEVRAQIYLPRDVHRRLKARARRDRKSMAEEVREALSRYLTEAPEVADPAEDPILKLVGFIRTGDVLPEEAQDPVIYRP